MLIWRRSYDTPPPPLEESDERFPGKDRRYTGMDPADVPKSESLKDTVARFLPIWHDTIAPTIKSGKRVIIAAHGNSLRALVKYLDDMSEEAILKLNIPTGVPLVYELDADLKVCRRAGPIGVVSTRTRASAVRFPTLCAPRSCPRSDAHTLAHSPSAITTWVTRTPSLPRPPPWPHRARRSERGYGTGARAHEHAPARLHRARPKTLTWPR